ncbi:MAG: NTP transferase domain-containing protein [Firmicutes bacterium]|nr:NTP transferase domain-containing protein [Bacillota bacterium]
MKKSQLAAIIPAAGLSSRMGSFKPLMSMGEITVIETIIHQLKVNGIDEIVVITGYRAEDIQRALAKENVTILYNGDYKKTHMFDSIRLGFAYMKDRADHLILWPVDIPAVTSDTVRKLLDATGEKNCQVVFPCHKGIHGHPVIFSADTYETILAHDGKEGMYGALKKLESSMEVEVDDPFVLMDMDTKEDYDRLIEKKREWETRENMRVTPLTFSFQLVLRYGENFFDENLVCLLRWIDRRGSLKKACEEMGIAYSYGWKLVRKAEQKMGFPLIHKVTGGHGGGGSTLTVECRKLMNSYELFCKDMERYGQKIFSKYFYWHEK